MHLSGLEGFEVVTGGRTLSGAYHGQRSSPLEGHLQVRMLDEEGNPLKGRYLVKSTKSGASERLAGYYEVEVPHSVLQMGTGRIDLSWVDFYRR